MDGSCRFAHGHEELRMTTAFKGHGKNSEKNSVEAFKQTAQDNFDQLETPEPKYQANLLASHASPGICDKIGILPLSHEDDETSEGSSPWSPRASSDHSSEVTQGSTNSGPGGASDFEYGIASRPAGSSPRETYENCGLGFGYPPSSGYADATSCSYGQWTAEAPATSPPTKFIQPQPGCFVKFANPSGGEVDSGDKVPGVRRQSWSQSPVHMSPMTALPPYVSSPSGSGDVARDTHFLYRPSNPQAAGHAAMKGGGPEQYYMILPSLLSEGGSPMTKEWFDGEQVAVLLAAAAPEYYED